MSVQLLNNSSNSNVVIQQVLSATLRYMTAALLTFTCLLGLTGYSLMIVVILKTQNIGGAIHAKLNSGNDGGSRALLLNAYLSGLIGSGVVIPVYIANIAGGTLVIPLLMCKIFGFLNVLTFNALLTTSVAIAIRQCLLLVTKTYGRYSFFQTRLVIAVSWLVPMVLALMASPYVGFNGNLLNCLFDSSVNMPPWFPTVVISAPVLIVVATILVCYALLFQSTKTQKRAFQRSSDAPVAAAVAPAPVQDSQNIPSISTVTGETTQQTADIRLQSLWAKARARNAKLAVKLIANWLIFASFWLPLAFMFLASVRSTVSPESWLVGSLLARLFYGMGWALFGIWNERLRHNLKLLLLGADIVNRKQVRPTAQRNEEPVVKKISATTTQITQSTDQPARLSVATESLKSLDG